MVINIDSKEFISTENFIKVKNILVIGQSQSGKSSFCNFLVQGENYEEKFEIGDRVNSKSKDVDFALLDYKIGENFTKFKIVDTPGFDDNRENFDLINKIKFYKYLIDLGKNSEILSAIVIIINMHKNANDIKRIIEFYDSVLGNAFRKNLFLVVTNVVIPKRRLRGKIREHDLPENILEIRRKIVEEILNLDYELPSFFIDTDPCEEIDYENACLVKENILLSCLENNIKIDNLKLYKHPKLLNSDNIAIEQLNLKLKELNHKKEEIEKQNNIDRTNIGLGDEISNLQFEINNLNDEINLMINSDDVILHVFNVKVFFKLPGDSWENSISLNHFVNRVWCTKGILSYKLENDRDLYLKLKPDSRLDFNSNIYITSTARHFYSKKINLIRKDIVEKIKQLEVKRNKKHESEKSIITGLIEYNKIEEAIKRTKNSINYLSNDYYFYDEVLSSESKYNSLIRDFLIDV